jgi:beta-lactamase class A
LRGSHRLTDPRRYCKHADEHLLPGPAADWPVHGCGIATVLRGVLRGWAWKTDIIDVVVEEFASVGVSGRLHVRDVDDAQSEIGEGANELVVLASVFKILVALEFARQSAAGQLDPSERVRVSAPDRLGGFGTAGCQDDVDLSWRDLAMFAMSLSDNTAGDLLLRRVGLDTVQALAAELGLTSTRISGGPRQLLESMFVELGVANEAEFAALFPTLGVERLGRLSVLDPLRATAVATPRDVTQLLSLIWLDRAGPAAACAEVRQLMSRQASWHGLAAAFGDEVAVAAKTGMVLGVRGEAGVVMYPDGRRYAVAVFTSGGWGRRPDVNAAMGKAARHAVDLLRAG